MDYELAKQLKDAGFPQVAIALERANWFHDQERGPVLLPTLEELIEACRQDFGFILLNPENGMWLVRPCGIEPIHPEFSGHKHYHTPREAVARFWLSLHSLK